MDVGAGTNLYPALLMLPWAEHIVFTEYASANIDWLSENLADAPGEWRLAALLGPGCGPARLRAVEIPGAGWRPRTRSAPLSIFDLPRRTWDLGSMFFVADGMTTDEAEFESAVRSFLDALMPGSPFMMAFMEGSERLRRSRRRFPSVKVTRGPWTRCWPSSPSRGPVFSGRTTPSGD